jgi:hypothetical protein
MQANSKDLHQQALFSLTIEEDLAMTSPIKVRESNMPNGLANAHGY